LGKGDFTFAFFLRKFTFKKFIKIIYKHQKKGKLKEIGF